MLKDLLNASATVHYYLFRSHIMSPSVPSLFLLFRDSQVLFLCFFIHLFIYLRVLVLTRGAVRWIVSRQKRSEINTTVFHSYFKSSLQRQQQDQHVGQSHTAKSRQTVR